MSTPFSSTEIGAVCPAAQARLLKGPAFIADPVMFLGDLVQPNASGLVAEWKRALSLACSIQKKRAWRAR
jgi:hypothetical protein